MKSRVSPNRRNLGKRPLRHELLESRRLLAAELTTTGDVSIDQPMPWFPATESIEMFEMHPSMDLDWLPELVAPVIAARPWRAGGLTQGPDLVQEVGNRVFVVDQDGPAGDQVDLLIFERGDDRNLTLVKEVEIGTPIGRMIVHDDHVVLIGSRPAWSIGRLNDDVLRWAGKGDTPARPNLRETPVITVSLADESELVRQSLPGLIQAIDVAGDQLVVVSNLHDVVIAAPAEGEPQRSVFPPPEFPRWVTTYRSSPQGIVEIASLAIPGWGSTVARGNDFFVAGMKPIELPWSGLPDTALDNVAEMVWSMDVADVLSETLPVTVSRFTLGDEIETVAATEIGNGFLAHFSVAEDGQTGVALLNRFAEGQWKTTLVLLRFADGGVEVFESIELPRAPWSVLSSDSDYVVLRTWDALAIVQADQSIDVAAENRVQKVSLPSSLRDGFASYRFGDRLVLRGQRATTNWLRLLPAMESPVLSRIIGGDPSEIILQPTEPIRPRVPEGSTVVTVSLSQARVTNETTLPDGRVAVAGESLIPIDDVNERFGIIVRGGDQPWLGSDGLSYPEANAWFLFGSLNDAGVFEPEGRIPVKGWLEIDANADRLVVRLADRMLQYDWDALSEPTVVPFPNQLPPIEAIADEYRLRSDIDHNLNVLANDQVHRRHAGPYVEIVELIGAPQGAEIVDGYLVRIPSETLQGVETLQFEYVISDGIQRSQASVAIDVVAIHEHQVESLIQAVRTQAAEDLGVDIDEVKVTSIDRIFDQPLPIVPPNNGEPFDLSPGILVILQTPNQTALYAASLEGRIVQVLAAGREFLAELSLAAVDAEGNSLSEIREGDEFFLQFNAQDLRSEGLGVYAAFFDLTLPTDHLVVTGPVQYGPGFAAVRGGEFNEGSIEELGALGTAIEPSGNGLQEVLRIGVRAVGAGSVRLRPGVADKIGHQLLLRGNNDAIAASLVRYRTSEWEILPPDPDEPLDTNGDGHVSASDALVVINFLGRYGTIRLTDLPSAMGSRMAEGELVTDAALQSMMRYDTNRSGEISAVDALLVINRLSHRGPTPESEEEEETTVWIGDEPAPIHGIEKSNL